VIEWSAGAAVDALDVFERWKEIEPIAPDQPWG